VVLVPKPHQQSQASAHLGRPLQLAFLPLATRNLLLATFSAEWELSLLPSNPQTLQLDSLVKPQHLLCHRPPRPLPVVCLVPNRPKFLVEALREDCLVLRRAPLLVPPLLRRQRLPLHKTSLGVRQHLVQGRNPRSEARVPHPRRLKLLHRCLELPQR